VMFAKPPSQDGELMALLSTLEGKDSLRKKGEGVDQIGENSATKLKKAAAKSSSAGARGVNSRSVKAGEANSIGTGSNRSTGRVESKSRPDNERRLCLEDKIPAQVLERSRSQEQGEREVTPKEHDGKISLPLLKPCSRNLIKKKDKVWIKDETKD